MSEHQILVVNLGAVSSKFALFSGSMCMAESSIPLDDAMARSRSAEQRPVRLQHLKDFIASREIDVSKLSAIAARGGLMKALPCPGVYRVDETMVDDLASERFGSHPSNLSAVIAQDLVQSLDKPLPVYVVDPVTTDTFWDVARISGVPDVQRFGRHHALNVRRAARMASDQIGKPLHECRFVVGHFGSGVSICTVVGGRTVDANDGQLGEGPFSVARAGTLPIRGVLDLAYGEPDRKKLEQSLSRSAGMSAYTGTADFKDIEKQLDSGVAIAHSAYRAMVYQSAKYIGAAAAAIGGPPDAIVLTGGLMKSKRFAHDLTEKVSWLGRTVLLPGEDELAALAEGVDAVLKLHAPALIYTEAEPADEAPPRTFDEVVSRALSTEGCSFVFAGGNVAEVAETVRYCQEQGIHGFTLVGPQAEIEELLRAEGVNPASVTIKDSTDVVTDSIALVKGQPGAVLVKGNCNTAALLKAVLDCLPKDNRPFLSHVAVVENPLGGRLVGISDGGLNLDPDRDKKIGIMVNAIAAFRGLGVRRPHVLLAAGMEDKGQDIPAIVDAREIVKRHKAGEWPEAVIDGPFGIDVALSGEAAASKGITSPVAGCADLVVTPNLESCNFAVKAAHYFTGRPWAGLVVGGPFPVIVGSRSDDAKSRVASIALARLVAAGYAKQAGFPASSEANG